MATSQAVFPPASWWEACYADQTEETAVERSLVRLLPQLPAEVLSQMGGGGARTALWGLGSGRALAVLRGRFPHGSLTGIDFSESLIEQARRREPALDYRIWGEEDASEAYAILFCVRRLRHFADPLSMLRGLLARCTDLCVVSVPLEEHPLGPHAHAQFRVESLPEHLGTFRAIHQAILPAEGDLGHELLVVYASADYRRRHPSVTVSASEMSKWNDYYAGLGEAQETPALHAFHEELAGALEGILPPGSSLLEAGCGAGFQSLALMRTGRYRMSLMDFSQEALNAAGQLFARNGFQVDMQRGDVFSQGEACHDLVFNSGVLEHYTLEEQIRFLKGMASRSRKYVLVLVPNRLCYWYWLWRMRVSRIGYWPFGKECPMADMSTAFRHAGIKLQGRAFLGAAWTEDLILNVPGLDEECKRDLLEIHRSPFPPREQKCYLMAAIGTVTPEEECLSPPWHLPERAEDFRTSELTTALADALALRTAGEARIREQQQLIRSWEENHQRLLQQLTESQSRLTETRAELASHRSFRASRTYRVAEGLVGLRQRIVPSGSWRAHTVRALLGTARKGVRLLSGLVRSRPRYEGQQLKVVSERARRNGLRPIVFLPSLAWTETLFQRPHQLARAFARLGHPVVFDCTGTEEKLTEVKEVEPNLFLHQGPPSALAGLPDPVVWSFTYNFHLLDRLPRGTTSVYDWIDDLSVFPHDQGMLRVNHQRALAEASLVVSVARRLHEEALRVRPDAVYLPNAADYDLFAAEARPVDDARLRAFHREGHPVMGYYGALARWFDYGLLDEVAARKSDWDFVLIGPDLDGSGAGQELFRRSNVCWLGPRLYETLPGYLRWMDVAAIPFVINDITLATSPLKLYEYLSAAKPVVTTPMPECMAHPEVHIAGSAEEFAAALDLAYHEARSETHRQRLRDLGRASSWRSRAEQVLHELASGPATTRHAA